MCREQMSLCTRRCLQQEICQLGRWDANAGLCAQPCRWFRANRQLAAHSPVLPSLWEVSAAGPACHGVLNSCRRQDSPTSQVLVSSSLARAMSSACVRALCVPCDAASPQERLQGDWDRAVMDQDGNVTVSGALRSVSWKSSGLSGTAWDLSPGVPLPSLGAVLVWS